MLFNHLARWCDRLRSDRFSNNSLNSHGSHRRINADSLATLTFSFKSNNTINQSKQRIIAAPTNIGTRMDFGAPLPNENVASPHRLSTVALNA